MGCKITPSLLLLVVAWTCAACTEADPSATDGDAASEQNPNVDGGMADSSTD